MPLIPRSSSVRNPVRTLGPAALETVEGRRLFAAALPRHGFGPPPSEHFAPPTADLFVIMPLTAVALTRAAAVESAIITATNARAAAVGTNAAAAEAGGPERSRAATPAAAGRAITVASDVAKAEPIAVRTADDDTSAVDSGAAAAATSFTPAVPVADAASGTTAPVFGPFRVAAVEPVSPPAAGPSLHWSATVHTLLQRPADAPTASRRPADEATASSEPVFVDAVAAVVPQQAALALPTEAIAARPLWQRLSAAVAGATLVAVNYAMRRRRRHENAARPGR